MKKTECFWKQMIEFKLGVIEHAKFLVTGQTKEITPDSEYSIIDDLSGVECNLKSIFVDNGSIILNVSSDNDSYVMDIDDLTLIGLIGFIQDFLE